MYFHIFYTIENTVPVDASAEIEKENLIPK